MPCLIPHYQHKSVLVLTGCFTALCIQAGLVPLDTGSTCSPKLHQKWPHPMGSHALGPNAAHEDGRLKLLQCRPLLTMGMVHSGSADTARHEDGRHAQLQHMFGSSMDWVGFGCEAQSGCPANPDLQLGHIHEPPSRRSQARSGLSVLSPPLHAPAWRSAHCAAHAHFGMQIIPGVETSRWDVLTHCKLSQLRYV